MQVLICVDVPIPFYGCNKSPLPLKIKKRMKEIWGEGGGVASQI